MKISRKAIWKTGAIAGALLCLAVLGSFWVLQSAWFRDQVRQRIVAQVETATGGKVEIAFFDYDWRKLTGDLQGFVIHGTEPPDAPPLLRIGKMRVTVRIISLLERSADVSSII